MWSDSLHMCEHMLLHTHEQEASIIGLHNQPTMLTIGRNHIDDFCNDVTQPALLTHFLLLAKEKRVIHCWVERRRQIHASELLRVNCTNCFSRDVGIGFYMIPAKVEGREAWLRAISRARRWNHQIVFAANILWAAGLQETLATLITFLLSLRTASEEQIAVYLTKTEGKGV